MTSLAVHNPGIEIAATPVHSAHAGPQDLNEFIRLAFLAWDSDRREVRRDVLSDFCRGMLEHQDSPVTIDRTWTGKVAPQAGFLVKPEWLVGPSGSNGTVGFWDNVRQNDGLLARIGFLSPTIRREFHVPAFNEMSRQDGHRWGGAWARWQGQEEIYNLSTTAQSLPTASDIVFNCNRLMLFSGKISRDLAADSVIFKAYLDYAYYSEIRYQLDAALLVGDGAGMPHGVAAAIPNTPSATYVVAADSMQTASTISTTNIDSMWSHLYGPCRKAAIWLASDDTVYAIDQAATTAGWPRSFYLPAGETQTGIPLIKGRPLIACEASPKLGSQGDLTLVDPTQVGLVYHRMTEGTDAGLEISIGLPSDSVETTTSDQFYFDTDSLAIKTKLRADGQLMWNSPLTIANGNLTVGPCCVIAVRLS